MTIIIDGDNTPTAGGIVYGDGTAYASTAAGSAGQVLQSNGSGAPSWVAAPATSPAGSTGQVQYNNAGAFGAISSGTSGQVLTSAGAGVVPSWSTISAGLTLATPVNTTSGTQIDFTGIPSTVKMIVVIFNGVRANTSSHLYIQLGDSGGIETIDYESQSSANDGGALNSYADSGGFVIYRNSSSAAVTGSVFINLQNNSLNTWIASGTLCAPGGSLQWMSCAGKKSLSATLDRIRLTTVSGGTFNLGQLNISYL